MPLKTALRRVMSGLALALGASLVVDRAYAQDAPKLIKAGIHTIYPPFEFKDPKSGELMGYDHEAQQQAP